MTNRVSTSYKNVYSSKALRRIKNKWRGLDVTLMMLAKPFFSISTNTWLGLNRCLFKVRGMAIYLGGIV